MRHGFHRLALLAGAFVAMLAPAVGARAQAPAGEAPAGSIRGTVLDAATAAGLGASTVTLIPRGGAGALPPGRAGIQFSNAVTTMTGVSGGYEFTGLAGGDYTVLVQRIGYEPARVDVQLAVSGDARVSIGLVVQPVRLQAVRVEARRDTAPSLRDLALADSSGRIAAALERQRLFLATDARELTAADMHEAVTLGSSDVLRALQRLPGVTHADEGSAMLWVRSNRWDHTRVFFDDVPLFHPLSALGALSGVNAAAIGTAFLLPGVRPVSLGGDGAARIDLRTNRGMADGKVRGNAELSLLGAGGAVGYRRADDRAGVQLTVRQGLNDLFRMRSMPTVFTRGLGGFRYDEATLRADGALGSGRLESSALYSRDEYASTSNFSATQQQWDTRAARLTYTAPVGRVLSSTTLAATRFDARHLHGIITWDSSGLHRVSFPASNSADYLTLGTRLIAADDSLGRRWSAGADAIRLGHAFRGSRTTLVPGDTATADTSGHGTLRYASLWAERRWQPTGRLAVETGLRIDVGGPGLPTARAAGSVQTRFALTPATAFSMSASRTNGYVQQVLHPYPGGIASGAMSRPWMTAGGDAPILTIDQASLGTELWLGQGYLLAGNVFARHSAGVVTGDPRPGSMIGRPFIVAGRESALGAEFSARKLVGRLTGLVAYTYQHARSEAAGWDFESRTNRPHALEATLSARLGRWQLGAGYALTAGAPRASIGSGSITCDSADDCTIVWGPLAYDTGDLRQLPLSTMDLLAEWTRSAGPTRLTFFLGAGVTFPAGRWVEPNAECMQSPTCRARITFPRSWYIAPALGVRLSF